MSPFGYHPPVPDTRTTAEEKDRRQTADILAREVTPAPTSGVLPVFFCRNEPDCNHRADGPDRLCPVCAPNPPKNIGEYVPIVPAQVCPAGYRGPLPPVPESCYPAGATPLEESA